MSITLLNKDADLKAASDYFCTDLTLPNTDAKNSSEIRCSGGLAGVEIVVKAAAAIASGALKIELLHSDTASDSSPAALTILDVTATAYAAGDEIIRFVPSTEIGAYGKLRFTTTADKSAETVTAYLTGISNR